jgi:methanogenic corrinoid protein MtbC1
MRTINGVPGAFADLCTSVAVAPRADFADVRVSNSRAVERRTSSRLVRTVEGEIVPRLLLSRRGAGATPVPANADGLDAGDAAELARLLLLHEIEIPFAYVEAIRCRGVSVQEIYLQLLAPAARRLGLLWERDECDFMQVTVGLGRLHQLLQRLSFLQPQPPTVGSRGHGRRVLLATAAGEQHVFGMLLVTQFFRQNGWEVWNEFPETKEDLASCVKRHAFSLVGISSASESRLDALSTQIRLLRRVSMNPGVAVMVGGAVFGQHPEWAQQVGADAMALDGREAAARAEAVCALLNGDK